MSRKLTEQVQLTESKELSIIEKLSTTYTPQAFLENLSLLGARGYKDFHDTLLNSNQDTLGVRVPTLRKIAKAIVKEGPDPFIAMDKGSSYELIMLEGMVLSYINKPFVELLPRIETFLDKVDNWAQIDSTVGHFKQISKDRSGVLAVIKRWLASDKEFVVRAGLIILLAKYIDTTYLPTIFQLASQVEHKGYYVMMGNAWLIATAMAKFPQETYNFLKENRLDRVTHNKAIQKARESFRVSQLDKERLLLLKR